ncbi:MAG: PEP/pyruvate-binding domain-containing protein [Acidimicrobiales bacterium]
MTEPGPIVWLEDYRPEDRCRVGGKNASLGEMIAAGLPVPPGFAVTTDAYDTMRRDPDVRDAVDRLLDAATDDPTALETTSRRVRDLLESVPVAAEVDQAIRHGYLTLCERCGVDDVPVAVRSSATCEDLPEASFAGEHDTYLWVRGQAAVVEHVRRCWSSLFTARAISYRRQMGFAAELVCMSVGVQKMVDPRVSGVAFTLNPTDGDRSQIAIDASWGLGEAVVAGEVTPDYFLVDKVLHAIVKRTISPKAVEYRVVDDGVEKLEVEAERQSVPCLSDDEITSVALMARRAERHYGCPQDIEWAIDRHLPGPDNVVLLQSRPETVWSRQPRTVSRNEASFMDGIVATLLAPTHASAARPTSTVEEEAPA